MKRDFQMEADLKKKKQFTAWALFQNQVQYVATSIACKLLIQDS